MDREFRGINAQSAEVEPRQIKCLSCIKADYLIAFLSMNKKKLILYFVLPVILIATSVVLYWKWPIIATFFANQQNNENNGGDDKKQEIPSNIDVQPRYLNELPRNLQNIEFADKYQKEDYEKAIKAEEDIKKNPEDYYGYNSAGFWWKGLGDITAENRELYFNRAIEIYSFAGKKFEDKKIYQPYQNLASVYIILKKYDKAEGALREAIKLASEVGDLYIRLADLYQNLMNMPPSKIIDLYEEALHQKSYQPDVLYPAYARYLCSIGKDKEAAEKTKLSCDKFKD